MQGDERPTIVHRLIAEHLRSPSLRHIRDPYAVRKLAGEIVAKLDRGCGLWGKWDGPREALVRAAAPCWVPPNDLRDYLNQMPGPALTTTDVVQRLRAVHEEDYSAYPNEELRPGCLALYETEKAAGTELAAIVGALQEYVDREEERLRVENRERWRRHAEEERLALEQRFLSGADCKWTALQRSKELYCRLNGRTYRLSPTADKMWNLHRVAGQDDECGDLIGKYRRRGDATKALAQIAYAPEPRR